jgi:peptide deformylase
VKTKKIVLADKLTRATNWISGFPKTREEWQKLAEEGIMLGPISDSLFLSCEEMVKAAMLYDGVGVAANQIGINQRMFVINEDLNNPKTSKNFRVYFHPSMVVLEGSTISHDSESCLSVPTVKVVVPRNSAIQASWFEIVPDSGLLKFSTREMNGYEARVFQHELDHLNGKSILDYASRDIRRHKDKFMRQLTGRRL